MRKPLVKESPSWMTFMALFAMMFVVLVLGFFAMRDMRNHVQDLEDGQISARERGFATAAHICMSEILTADSGGATAEEIREGMSGFCSAPERIVYYLPIVCQQLFPDIPKCGTKVDEPVL